MMLVRESSPFDGFLIERINFATTLHLAFEFLEWQVTSPRNVT